ncbi:MAG: metal ABC transporter ATP-binding protein [Eubacteriales bacterium]|nr:metal ABC transporter ATP-binding protein [Eubacteriales bacterium]
MKTIALSVHDLTVAYDLKPVVWDIDIEIPAGTLTGIIGPNGAGKSTIIKAVNGMLKTLSGFVRFPLLELKYGKNAKKHIAYVPQSGSVDWDFPARAIDVVLMGRYAHLGWFKRPGKEDKQMAMQMLQRVGMAEFATRQISQLSGGQQQRVFLARALAQQADLYFMDEPFKGVDAQTEKTFISLLKELRGEGKTIVVVHHDLQTVAEYFDYLLMVNVTVKAAGPTKEIFTQENLNICYRGKAKAPALKEV